MGNFAVPSFSEAILRTGNWAYDNGNFQKLISSTAAGCKLGGIYQTGENWKDSFPLMGGFYNQLSNLKIVGEMARLTNVLHPVLSSRPSFGKFTRWWVNPENNDRYFKVFSFFAGLLDHGGELKAWVFTAIIKDNPLNSSYPFFANGGTLDKIRAFILTFSCAWSAEKACVDAFDKFYTYVLCGGSREVEVNGMKDTKTVNPAELQNALLDAAYKIVILAFGFTATLEFTRLKDSPLASSKVVTGLKVCMYATSWLKTVFEVTNKKDNH